MSKKSSTQKQRAPGVWGRTRRGLALLSLFWLSGLSSTHSFASTDPLALAQTRHCLSCHALDHKVVGPAYMDVAKKYQNDPTALARLSVKVRLGGGGVWGAVPMPANAAVSEQEAQELVRWILKTPPSSP